MKKNKKNKKMKKKKKKKKKKKIWEIQEKLFIANKVIIQRKYKIRRLTLHFEKH
jgi:hypothetical protein